MKKIFVIIFSFIALAVIAQDAVEPRKLPIYDSFGNLSQEQIFFDGGIGIIKGIQEGVSVVDFDFIASGVINRKVYPLTVSIQLDYVAQGGTQNGIAICYDYTNEIKYFKKKNYPSDHEFVLIKNIIITIKQGGKINTYKGDLTACVKIGKHKTLFDVNKVLDSDDMFMFDIAYQDKCGDKRGWTIYTLWDGD